MSPLRLRALRTLALALLLSLTTIGLPAVAHASALPVVTITWSRPDAPVKAGQPLSVTITATWAANPDPDAYYEEVYPDYRIDGDYQPDADEPLTPENPSVTYEIATATFGTTRHRIEVWSFFGSEGTKRLALSTRDVTVIGDPTTVTATWPGSARTPLGRTLAVKGTVSPSRRRTVVLQHLTNAGWQNLATTTAAANGTFALPIPTTWLTQHRLRVAAPATTTHMSAYAPQTKTLTVAPTYKPLGSAKNFVLMGYRYDPCQTITYRINATRAPRGAVRDIHKAFRMMSQATGLRFKYVGTSKMVPLKGQGPRGGPPRARIPNADFLIGYATPKQVPALAGGTTGIGGPSSNGPRDAKGVWKIDQSQVALDSTQKGIRGGFGARYTRGELMLHEIGHGVGLDHSFTPHQIMSYNTLAKDRFGAGDLVGLRKVGRSAGCFVEKPYQFRSRATAEPVSAWLP